MVCGMIFYFLMKPDLANIMRLLGDKEQQESYKSSYQEVSFQPESNLLGAVTFKPRIQVPL